MTDVSHDPPSTYVDEGLHSDLHLTIVSCTYQRNGISGEGFYAFDLLVSERTHPRPARVVGRRKIPATSPEPPEPPHRALASLFEDKGYCAVIDPDRPTCCWRGDRYERPLRRYLADHQRGW